MIRVTSEVTGPHQKVFIQIRSSMDDLVQPTFYLSPDENRPVKCYIAEIRIPNALLQCAEEQMQQRLQVICDAGKVACTLVDDVWVFCYRNLSREAVFPGYGMILFSLEAKPMQVETHEITYTIHYEDLDCAQSANGRINVEVEVPAQLGLSPTEPPPASEPPLTC